MKVKEFRELNDQEVKQKYQDLKEEYFNLRMQKATGQIEKPVKLKFVRRDIAKLKTVANEKKIKL